MKGQLIQWMTNLAVDNPGTGGVGRGGRSGCVPSVRPQPDGLVGGYNAILFPLDIRQLGNLLLPGQFEVLASLDKFRIL